MALIPVIQHFNIHQVPVFASKDVRLKQSTSSTKRPTIQLTAKKQRVVVDQSPVENIKVFIQNIIRSLISMIRYPSVPRRMEIKILLMQRSSRYLY